jgi:hypothetical protein
MRAMSSIFAAAAFVAVASAVAPAGAATAENANARPATVRSADACPDRPRIHVRRYGQRGGGAPTRCPPKG